ncbi:MAG: tetratricopeptide repeat protein [Erythrobacter sp.]|uniref:tetratricopeptide repeat protein n=1 Tax=Erythrobacter sp. TaxID=1042 RepID=UPI003C7660C1
MKLVISAIALASLAGSGAALAQQPAVSDAPLAAQTIANGEQARAILILERQLEQHPDDPALLINLGIANAQLGQEVEARERFEAAMSSRQSIDLETANGSLMDSRKVARRALAMLERGEFRSRDTTRNLSMR